MSRRKLGKRKRTSKETARPQRKPKRRPVLWGMVVVGALVVAGGLWAWLGRPPSGQQPDIFLISIDTLRADRLGCYGYSAIPTPNIDRLAAEGVVFDATTSQVPITLPSHASMLTGLIPPRHGVRLNTAHRLPESVLTMTEVLRDKGYQTGAFVGGLPMVKAGGLDQGFEVYDDELSEETLPDADAVARRERYAEDVLTAVRGWLRATDPQRPLFAFIHLYDPHAPYLKAPPGSATAGYDGEVAYVDRALGAFFSSRAFRERPGNRLTVLTSDHGEGLGEHNEKTHGVFVYESTLRVPLIVHWPGVLAPRRVPLLVGLIDIPPTILELAKLPALPDIDGASLTPSMSGATEDQRPFYFESLLGYLDFGWAPLRGMRRGDLKYISAPRPELYNLDLDPHERSDLYAARSSEAAELAEYLVAIGEGTRSTFDADEQTLEQLASLGYVSAPPAVAADTSELADPKDRIAVYDRFQHAHMEFAQGRFDETLAIMEELEPFLNRSPLFYYRWGNFAARIKRWDRAASSYEECLALDAGRQKARLNLGVAYLESNAPVKSLEQFETLLQINPDYVEAHLYAGAVQSQHLSAPEEAVAHWTRFLELAPDHEQAEQVRKALAKLKSP